MTEIAMDTNIYSAFMRGERSVATVLQRSVVIHLPFIVLGELLAGFSAGSRSGENREQLAQFMASPRVQLLNPNEKTPRYYAETYAALRKQGKPIPSNDLWIAALALQHGVPLFSLDAHFGHVPGMVLIS